MLRWGPAEQTKYASQLDLYINAASRTLEGRYGPLEETATAVVVDGAASVSVPVRHLTSVDTVEVDNAGSWVENTGWTADLAAGLVYGPFTRGRQNVRVTYTAGFDPIPDDVTWACTSLVAHMWSIASQRGPGLPEDFTTVPTGFLLPNAVKEAMARYDRMPGFA